MRYYVVVVLVLGWAGHTMAQVDSHNVKPVGAAGIRLGIYSADKLEETSTTGSYARQRTASNVYLAFNFTRMVWHSLAAEGSVGALSRGDAIVRDASGTYVQRARITLYPLSAGFRLYPLGLGSHRISPYVNAAGSLVLATQVFQSSGTTGLGTFNYRSSTDATLGANAGAGADVHIGGRMLLGFFGGYQRARFAEPLSGLPGGVTDFSGPQFMITFGYLITGAKHGPRGEGKNGD
jgi:hypothetical protein